MSETDELLEIADNLARLKGKFVDSSGFGMYLPTDEASQCEAMVAEAKAIIVGALGPANEFTMGIIKAVSSVSGGFISGPSYKCVSDVEALIRGAIRQISRKRRAPSQGGTQSMQPYVNPMRIAAIEALKSSRWDFSKLAQLCKELNAVHTSECHYATAMLIRAIADHVAPVFGLKSFSQVASNYSGGGSSFKKSMEHLNNSLRNIADGMLHEQIRRSETHPSPQQVEFRQDLDRLLGEIVRIVPSDPVS